MTVKLANKANTALNIAFDLSKSKNRNSLNGRNGPRNKMEKMRPLLQDNDWNEMCLNIIIIFPSYRFNSLMTPFES